MFCAFVCLAISVFSILEIKSQNNKGVDPNVKMTAAKSSLCIVDKPLLNLNPCKIAKNLSVPIVDTDLLVRGTFLAFVKT